MKKILIKKCKWKEEILIHRNLYKKLNLEKLSRKVINTVHLNI